MIKMISKKQFYRLSLFWSILMGCLAFEWLIIISIGMIVNFAEFGYHGGLIILITAIIPHIVIWILGMIVLLILYLVEI